MEHSTLKESLRLLAAEIDSKGRLDNYAKFILNRTAFDGCAIYLFDNISGAYILRGLAGKSRSFAKSLTPGKSLKEIRPDKRFKRVSGDFAWIGKNIAEPSYVYTEPRRKRPGLIVLKSAKAGRIGAQRQKELDVLFLEIAALERMREKIAGYEKMNSLGDMAATLVHELKNPILSIGGYALRLKHHLNDAQEAEKYINQLVDEARRLETLTGAMIDFLREEQLNLMPTDLNSIISESLSLLEGELENRAIKTKLNLQEGGARVLADRIQLKIAFDNIITNAIQSMETGGTLTIETRQGAASAEISFADTGGGINPAHLTSIFKPLFTTKKHGTGLGLPIVNSIVSRHNGTIEIDNKKGLGVKFNIKFAKGPVAN